MDPQANSTSSISAPALPLQPISEEVLLDRLRKRKREPEPAIQRRFAKAKEEIATAKRCGVYSAFVVNDDLRRAERDAVEVIRNEWAARTG